MPKDPYWVQIERAPQGNQTGAFRLNLADVAFVNVFRVDNELNTVQVIICPEGTSGNFAIDFDKMAAETFLKLFNPYQTRETPLKYIDDAARASKIQIADKSLNQSVVRHRG